MQTRFFGPKHMRFFLKVINVSLTEESENLVVGQGKRKKNFWAEIVKNWVTNSIFQEFLIEICRWSTYIYTYV